MAVAAYSSLVSLMHVLDNVQHPARRHRLHLDRKQIGTLQEKVRFLQDFLEVHSQRKSHEMQDLAMQISVVANEAEDIIDLYVVDQLCEGPKSRSQDMSILSSFCQDINKVIEKLDSVKREFVRVLEEERTGLQGQKPVSSPPACSSTVLPSGAKNSTMVGFDERLERVMDELTGHKSDLQILPIVGMGGIGKTTLARNVLEHPYIVHRFDMRIWFTISQEYNAREILVHFLIDGKNQENNETLAELGERLYKSLCGQKYLIVMDDVWSTDVWDDLKRFFPNNRNGSRILVTTRLFNVAVSLGSQSPYIMEFLDESKSWDLFCEKAFSKQGCPFPELEKIGKYITKCCRGLPLAIVVIGGLLANSKMTLEDWEFVAENSLSNQDIPKSTSVSSPSLLPISGTLQAIVVVEDSTILENLQTLSFVLNFRCTTNVLERLPNLKKLKIFYDYTSREWSYYCLYNLPHLHKLESLLLQCERFFLKNMTFPHTLKKLTLRRCGIPWEDITAIGSLPNLEVLKLYYNAFKGHEWNPIEGEFLSLRFLLMKDVDVVSWGADKTNFPNLESLVLEDIINLKEIPSGIGEIETLHSIHLVNCSDSIINSAKHILEEQQSLGIEALQLHVQTKEKYDKMVPKYRPPRH
ncbi:putative late blight resistance proteinR1B-8 [Sesamum alatum]|uniref:Late blight resistance proteinR1B-8 n=1 Tax=Sesamum alatum TaxID=300844 RepID=A0AAE2CWL0_9LAMI|nr:putative late blight resistance proteinR1B-8 [Sesamum alatum]